MGLIVTKTSFELKKKQQAKIILQEEIERRRQEEKRRKQEIWGENQKIVKEKQNERRRITSIVLGKLQLLRATDEEIKLILEDLEENGKIEHFCDCNYETLLLTNVNVDQIKNCLNSVRLSSEIKEQFLSFLNNSTNEK